MACDRGGPRGDRCAQKPQRLELTAEFAFVPGMFSPRRRSRRSSPRSRSRQPAMRADARRRQLVAIVGTDRVVETRGKNGSVYVEGTLTRVDIDVWHEKNTENGDAIRLHDGADEGPGPSLRQELGLWLSST